MYPTVVMLLVETQRSMANVCEISPSNASKFAAPVASEARPSTLRHLSFAAGPVHTTTDNKAKSRRSHALCRQGGQVTVPFDRLRTFGNTPHLMFLIHKVDSALNHMASGEIRFPYVADSTTVNLKYARYR